MPKEIHWSASAQDVIDTPLSYNRQAMQSTIHEKPCPFQVPTHKSRMYPISIDTIHQLPLSEHPNQSIGFSSFVSLSYLLTVRSICVKRSRFSLPTTAPLKKVSSSATVVPDSGMCARNSAAVGKGTAVGGVAPVENDYCEWVNKGRRRVRERELG